VEIRRTLTRRTAVALAALLRRQERDDLDLHSWKQRNRNRGSGSATRHGSKPSR